MKEELNNNYIEGWLKVKKVESKGWKWLFPWKKLFVKTNSSALGISMFNEMSTTQFGSVPLNEVLTIPLKLVSCINPSHETWSKECGFEIKIFANMGEKNDQITCKYLFKAESISHRQCWVKTLQEFRTAFRSVKLSSGITFKAAPSSNGSGQSSTSRRYYSTIQKNKTNKSNKNTVKTSMTKTIRSIHSIRREESRSFHSRILLESENGSLQRSSNNKQLAEDAVIRMNELRENKQQILLTPSEILKCYRRRHYASSPLILSPEIDNEAPHIQSQVFKQSDRANRIVRAMRECNKDHQLVPAVSKKSKRSLRVNVVSKSTTEAEHPYDQYDSSNDIPKIPLSPTA